MVKYLMISVLFLFLIVSGIWTMAYLNHILNGWFLAPAQMTGGILIFIFISCFIVSFIVAMFAGYDN